VILYLIGISSVSPFINTKNSSEQVLKVVADLQNCITSDNVRTVGVSTDNTFSHYWVSKAWATELPEEIKLSYVTPETVIESNVCYYIVKKKALKSITEKVKSNFSLIKQSGNWLIYQRHNPSLQLTKLLPENKSDI